MERHVLSEERKRALRKRIVLECLDNPVHFVDSLQVVGDKMIVEIKWDTGYGEAVLPKPEELHEEKIQKEKFREKLAQNQKRSSS